MNTNQYRNHLLDEDWVVAIEEEIAAMPETLADIVDPEIMGRYDAEMGNPCDPTKYYAKLGQVEAYIIAYKTVTEQWAAAVQEVNDSIVGGKFIDHDAELEDAIEGWLDEQFWRGGLF